MARQAALPPSLAPRLIGREAAAAYCSLAPGSFDKLVDSGQLPKPRRLPGTTRKAWDVRALDAYIDNLPVDGADDADDSWSDVDAA